MSPTLKALARQLAASPRWRWLDGAMYLCPPGGYRASLELPPPAWAIPDLSDPLTAAGLLVIAREIAGPKLYTSPSIGGWNVIRDCSVWVWGKTEVEALAAVILWGGE